jgi:hypothetical protein
MGTKEYALHNCLCGLIVPQRLMEAGVQQNSQDHAHRTEVEKGYSGRRVMLKSPADGRVSNLGLLGRLRIEKGRVQWSRCENVV